MIPVLLYHKITGFDVSGTWVTRGQFKQQMKYLYEQGYTTVEPDEWMKNRKKDMAHGAGSKVQGAGRKQVLITFDDGYESFYSRALPILTEYGFKALIFVVTSYIGKKSYWDVNFGTRDKHLDLRELKELRDRGFMIGSHTRTHPDLTRISPDQTRDEILGSKSELEDALGSEVKYISFPFGRHTTRTVDLSLECGYELVFTSSPFVKHEQAVGRTGLYIIDQMPNFKAKVHGSGAFYLAEAHKTRIINSFSRGTWMWKTLNPFTKPRI
jgi:peptidoglycan/xylan/chitin deacetylase (PgdA/CDA1 family)